MRLIERRGRNRKFRAKWVLVILFAIMIVDCIAGYGYAQKDAITVKAAVLAQDNQVKEASLSATLSENDALLKELEAYKAKHPNPTEQEIEAYVKTIFGKDAKVAIEVSHHECWKWDKKYPKCNLKSSVENSVGLFQINLENKNHWVHAARIPGKTIPEKELWLENPLNNTLYAYWLFSRSGNFCAWSGFTKHAYIQEMAGYSCK